MKKWGWMQMTETKSDPQQASKTMFGIRDIVLLVIGALLAHYFNSYSYEQSAADGLANARIERSIESYQAYEKIGAASDNAAMFLSGEGGDADDLNIVYRHFRNLSALIVAGEADAKKAAELYSGRLQFWGGQLSNIDLSKSTEVAAIPSERRKLMADIGKFLLYLSANHQPPRIGNSTNKAGTSAESNRPQGSASGADATEMMREDLASSVEGATAIEEEEVMEAMTDEVAE